MVWSVPQTVWLYHFLGKGLLLKVLWWESVWWGIRERGYPTCWFALGKCKDTPLGFTLPTALMTSSFGGDPSCVPWALPATSVIAESELSYFCQIVSYWTQLFCNVMVFCFINQWWLGWLRWITYLVSYAQKTVDFEVLFNNLLPFKYILVYTNFIF